MRQRYRVGTRVHAVVNPIRSEDVVECPWVAQLLNKRRPKGYSTAEMVSFQRELLAQVLEMPTVLDNWIEAEVKTSLERGLEPFRRNLPAEDLLRSVAPCLEPEGQQYVQGVIDRGDAPRFVSGISQWIALETVGAEVKRSERRPQEQTEHKGALIDRYYQIILDLDVCVADPSEKWLEGHLAEWRHEAKKAGDPMLEWEPRVVNTLDTNPEAWREHLRDRIVDEIKSKAVTGLEEEWTEEELLAPAIHRMGGRARAYFTEALMTGELWEAVDWFEGALRSDIEELWVVDLGPR